MHSGASLPLHAGGSGMHASVPLGCTSGMYAPQQVHFCSQYSSMPQVAAPHFTGCRVVVVVAGGAAVPPPLLPPPPPPAGA